MAQLRVHTTLGDIYICQECLNCFNLEQISIAIAWPEIVAFTINEQKIIYMPGLNHQTDYDLN